MMKPVRRNTKPPQQALAPRPEARGHQVLMAVALAALTMAVYARAVGHDFVQFDDTDYVINNPIVQAGLTWHGVIYAFTTNAASNWHPLTWLSYMLDCEIWGVNPAAFHAENIAWHVLNVLLLFRLLAMLTAATWRSALVAALFAIHPLHVESVAWVAERKDVISTVFGLLAIIGYVRYTRAASRRWTWYFMMLASMALSLLAKPMLVTLPGILMLLDFWPLRRWPIASADKVTKVSWRTLILEKIPPLTLAAASSVITVWAQQSGGAMYSLVLLPVEARITNAAVSYWLYVYQMIWPAGLAVLYPHPGQWPAWQIAMATVFLLGMTALALVWRTSRPWLMVGWLWYLGTLVPVIGLVQVGFQAMADRYTYVPLIGLFIIIAWSIPTGWFSRGGTSRMLAMAIAGACLVVFSFLSWRQLGYWRNSNTLFERALAVTKGNFIIEYNLGCVLRLQDDNDGAIRQFTNAINILPEYSPAHDNLGNALASKERYDEAIEHYREAIRYFPDSPMTYNNLGSALVKLNRLDEAVAAYRQSLQRDSTMASVHENLGSVLLAQRKYDEAAQSLGEAVRLDPERLDARIGLGKALAVIGQLDQAISQFSEVLRRQPDHAEAALLLGRLQEFKQQNPAP